MDMEQRIATWVAMMKTSYCNARGLSHQQFLELDECYGLIHYLFSNYELLHNYGNEAVAEDIDRYLVGQEGNGSGKKLQL